MTSISRPHVAIRFSFFTAAIIFAVVVLLTWDLATDSHFTEEEREWCREEHPNLSFTECAKHFTY